MNLGLSPLLRILNLLLKVCLLLISKSQFSMSSWVFLHEVLHELCQVLSSFDRHGVVHWDSDALVEGMASDLNDSTLPGLLNKSFFQLFVSVLDPENYIDSRSVCHVGDLGLVVSVWGVHERPKNFRSLRGKIFIVVYTSHFVHVGNVHSGHIHWVNCGSVVVGIWWLLM